MLECLDVLGQRVPSALIIGQRREKGFIVKSQHTRICHIRDQESLFCQSCESVRYCNCLPTEHLGAFLIELEFGSVGF